MAWWARSFEVAPTVSRSGLSSVGLLSPRSRPRQSTVGELSSIVLLYHFSQSDDPDVGDRSQGLGIKSWIVLNPEKQAEVVGTLYNGSSGREVCFSIIQSICLFKWREYVFLF